MTPSPPDHQRARTLLHQFFRDPLNNATTLDLTSCHLRRLPDDFPVLIRENPTAAARLTLLNLAHNSLATLPKCLTELPNLRILFLLKNAFTAVPPVVRHLSSLTMLSFKENLLHGPLAADTLPPNLVWLILTSNRITALSDDFPLRCSRVRKLMLSNNTLSALPPDFHLHMTELELLRLANNSFLTIPPRLLETPHLTWLSLAGNPCAGGAATPAQLPAALKLDLENDFSVHWDAPFGSGTSGTAFPGTHLATGRRVAVKKFKSLRGSDGRALDEVAVSLAAAGVPSVVSPLGYSCATDDDGDVDELTLVTELVDGDARTIAGPPSFESCTRSVYDKEIVLSEEEAARVVAVVERAVQGLLERGIAHGDVYGHNVLVGWVEGEIIVYLGDLGAAWRFEEKDRERVASLERRAVEVFRKEVMAMAR